MLFRVGEHANLLARLSEDKSSLLTAVKTPAFLNRFWFGPKEYDGERTYAGRSRCWSVKLSSQADSADARDSLKIEMKEIWFIRVQSN